MLEKSNWTGHGVLCPRSVFSEAKSRGEFARTGIYVLLGQSAEGELPGVYIGEGDPIRPRLEQHQRNLDFWTAAICFTSKDANLNKAHVQYLESRLVDLATTAKRSTLQNGNAPQLPSLSEADTADTEAFLAEMLLCFPVLGVTVFEKPEKPSRKRGILTIKAKGVQATGYESPGGFVVLAGSTASLEEAPSFTGLAKQMRKELQTNGVLVNDGTALRFTADYEFSSPSAASSAVLGRSSNGRTDWLTPGGRTLKSIQESASPL